MQIADTFPQFLDSEALLIVAGKTTGKIYRIANAEITHVETLENQLETYSDNEGFFFSGVHGGGAPKERNDEENHIAQLRKTIAKELDQLIKKESAKVLYIFEPEHLKGRIEEVLQSHPQLKIITVAYGNFVQESPKELLHRIQQQLKEHTPNQAVDFEKDLERYS